MGGGRGEWPGEPLWEPRVWASTHCHFRFDPVLLIGEGSLEISVLHLKAFTLGKEKDETSVLLPLMSLCSPFFLKFQHKQLCVFIHWVFIRAFTPSFVIPLVPEKILCSERNNHLICHSFAGKLMVEPTCGCLGRRWHLEVRERG